MRKVWQKRKRSVKRQIMTYISSHPKKKPKPLGFVITVVLGRYLGAGDLGLYRMASTIYGIAMLVAALGIPGAMIKI
ncbi:MAG: oligosaccharide flippase family protein [Candidatus Methanospirare jalkutatii]|nr:oligosaccharide flippase family protein [Candidatus Methanospirare jalkutatii]